MTEIYYNEVSLKQFKLHVYIFYNLYTLFIIINY